MTKRSMIAAHGFRMTPAERRMGRLMRSPDGHGNSGEQQQEQQQEEPKPKGQEQQQEQQQQQGDSAELIELRRQRDEARAAAAKFDGIDPEVAKANAKKVADAEAATRVAEADKAKAEGNFERLRELQNEEHQAQIDALKTERDEANQLLVTARVEAQKAKVTSAFSASEFFAKETILSPAKAERLYGDHVEMEDGEAVVYDAPKGITKRVKIMDSKGNPLSFDVAMKKVFDAEPDKDTYLKSKVAPGGGSKTVDAKPTPPAGDRLSKMSAGLKKLRGQ